MSNVVLIRVVCFAVFLLRLFNFCLLHLFIRLYRITGGSVAEWLACWTQAEKGLGSNRSRDAVE